MSTTPALPTIEEARATHARAEADHDAGRIDRRAFLSAVDAFLATATELAADVRLERCPQWCNDHEFVYGDIPAEDINNHRRNIKGNGWEVEVSEIDKAPGTFEFVRCDIDDLMSLEDARAYAVAIVETIDAVTGETR